MLYAYSQIYEEVQDLIKTHHTRDPKTILEDRGVGLIAFKENTKLLGMYKIILGRRFVFYNPYVDYRIRTMVLAHELGHDIYHKVNAKDNLVEFEISNIKDEMEIEANIFAAHLLLDEKQIMDDIMAGYTYNELASIYEVDPNLMIFKLNEMRRMGMPIRGGEITKAGFFKDIDGTDMKNFEIYE